MLRIISLSLSILLSASVYAESFSLIPYTRLIFDGSRKSNTFTPKMDSKIPYLILTAVYDDYDTKNISSKFLVIPEITEIRPGYKPTFVVRRLTNDFPRDRETLLYIVGNFIPSVKKDDENSKSVAISYSMQYKLIYRPESLLTNKNPIDDLSKELKVKVQGKKLTIENPTGYHSIINYMYLDNDEVDIAKFHSIIEPFKSVTIDLKKKYKVISWSLLSDTGSPTIEETRQLLM